MEAVVKWFNNEKGYGFVEDNNNNDIFVHYSTLKQDNYQTLQIGDIVEFDLVRTEKGYQAKNVILKVQNKIKKIVTKENIGLVADIATIAGLVLSTIRINNDIPKNPININCQNCEIQIIETDEKQIVSITQKE